MGADNCDGSLAGVGCDDEVTVVGWFLWKKSDEFVAEEWMSWWECLLLWLFLAVFGKRGMDSG